MEKLTENMIRWAESKLGSTEMRSSALPTAVTVRSCIANQPTGTSEEA